MEELRIHAINFEPIGIKDDVSVVKRSPLIDFKEILTQSIHDLNQELLKADQIAQEMILGEVDVHQAMIAIEQAHLTLRLMIQVRNKIISAYEEIMRMQF